MANQFGRPWLSGGRNNGEMRLTKAPEAPSRRWYQTVGSAKRVISGFWNAVGDYGMVGGVKEDGLSTHRGLGASV
jgi:hypothetical protein